MSTITHLVSSPRGETSHSNFVARRFLDAYAKKNPSDVIERVDLWAEKLMPLDANALDAKYAVLHGKEHTKSQAETWAAMRQTLSVLARADKWVFSVPMWNFSIPYSLKHFIDVVTQPGLAFSYSPATGYTGLLSGKKALIVLSSGGTYDEPSPVHDFVTPYLKQWLAFIGVTDVTTINVAPLLADPATVETARTTACRNAERIAQSF